MLEESRAYEQGVSEDLKTQVYEALGALAQGFLDQFANARSFPGGYTRTTLKKLQLTRVPAYDPDADLTPLVELSDELAGVRDDIAGTDHVIDQIVYCLYGLTEEEIAVVEGRV